MRGALERRERLARHTVRPLTATSVSFVSCAHGAVFIRLHDENGRIFASASFTADQAPAVGISFAETISEAVSRAAPTSAMH